MCITVINVANPQGVKSTHEGSRQRFAKEHSWFRKIYEYKSFRMAHQYQQQSRDRWISASWWGDGANGHKTSALCRPYLHLLYYLRSWCPTAAWVSALPGCGIHGAPSFFTAQFRCHFLSITHAFPFHLCVTTFKFFSRPHCPQEYTKCLARCEHAEFPPHGRENSFQVKHFEWGRHLIGLLFEVTKGEVLSTIWLSWCQAEALHTAAQFMTHKFGQSPGAYDKWCRWFLPVCDPDRRMKSIASRFEIEYRINVNDYERSM